MPHDPILSADVHSWLLKAAADLRGAEIDLAAEPPLVEDALFHCQQAAEKSLKAFLVFHDVPFRKTHSIEEIGEAALSGYWSRRLDDEHWIVYRMSEDAVLIA